MKRSLAGTASLLAVFILGCSAQQPTTFPVTYSQYELEYRLLAEFVDVFWNDPDLYPVAREGQELQNAVQQFDQIRSNEAEFAAILAHLRLDSKDVYTNEEKLLIYRQHKLLNLAVQMTPVASGGYGFVLRIGEGQGERIEGTISSSGRIDIRKREPSVNTHPICLTRGTLIATPTGEVPIEDIRPGLTVWTLDDSGNRVVEPVLKTAATSVSTTFRVVSIVLSDGRSIAASPGHPSSERWTLGDYHVGDALDGSTVASTMLVPYWGDQTYDLLPGGGQGVYWANGILLKSTLSPP